MADDLKEYLVILYVLPFDDSDHYLISPKRETTYNDILVANHWNIVADECQGNDALYSIARNIYIQVMRSVLKDITRLLPMKHALFLIPYLIRFKAIL